MSYRYLRISQALAVAMLMASANAGAQSRGWVKDQSTGDAVDEDLIQCKYEAESSTAAVGTGKRVYSMGDAVGQGIADGIVKAMAQHDLIKDCMKAKGYSHPKYGAATSQK